MNSKSSVDDSVQIVSQVTTAYIVSLGSTSSAWIPIAVHTGDWGAATYGIWNLMMENSTYKAVWTRLGPENTTSGYIWASDKRARRLDIVYIRRTALKAYRSANIV